MASDRAWAVTFGGHVVARHHRQQSPERNDDAGLRVNRNGSTCLCLRHVSFSLMYKYCALRLYRILISSCNWRGKLLFCSSLVHLVAKSKVQFSCSQLQASGWPITSIYLSEKLSSRAWSIRSNFRSVTRGWKVIWFPFIKSTAV